METKVQLISSDQEILEVELWVINESQTLKALMEEVGPGNNIHVPNVNGMILTKVVDYCRYHVKCRERSEGKQVVPMEEIQQWDEDFCRVDYPTLRDLIEAAGYLNIRGLQDLASQAIGDMVNARPPQRYNFTPEEEEQMRQENPWAFQ